MPSCTCDLDFTCGNHDWSAEMFAALDRIPVMRFTRETETADRVYEGRDAYKGWEPE